MRVIAGALKGQRLTTPKGRTTRPTADQVRIACLDTLMPYLELGPFLDLFAGAGGVGIDVPNASVMLVEHAERFGLSQLHQLRGRVGRGPFKSFCILLSAAVGEDSQRRIEAMTETNDGFKIAEVDLALRGPGEFFGTRQSGLPEFRVADLLRDGAVLEQARREAFAVVQGDPSLLAPAHRRLRAALLARWRGKLDLAGVG